ncbi:MAG: phenylalanine--tRNA ligase subunit beta [Armatimonadota bacterium]|nr:phenylalanine--tRNA ligase subunit beta [bacterium]
MKLSTNWLKEYIDINCPLDELAQRLTMAGLEVEETIPISKEAFAKAGGSGTTDDVVWDVKVTPNRGDWLSVLGAARECAPLVGGKAKTPNVEIGGCDPSTAESIKIRIDDPDLCKRYVGVVVRNVKVAESPGWLKDRLIASGMRPINNIVDVTNFVMMELGQPLHAFDYKLLHGSQIIVRRAKPGETMATLDGEERKLENDMLVIADADRPVALAGVMGGLYSEISEQTQEILIESANFNSVSIRRTSKRLGLVTESSYRYERTVDPSIAPVAAMRAAQLISELAGGEIARGLVDEYPVPVEPLELKVRPERVNAILGTAIDTESMAKYLDSLEIETSVVDGLLACRIPTFRSDITREIEVVEEVGRAYGYENFAMTLPKSSLQGKDSPEGQLRDRIRRSLMMCGCQEALTHSLVDSKLADMTDTSDICVKVRNPLSEELDGMRTMLAPNLLQVIGRNQSYGMNDVSVFEVGKVYFQNSDGVPGERLAVAGALVGNMWRSGWSLPEEALQVDFFTCKAVVENLLDALGIKGATYTAGQHPLMHATRTAKVFVGDKEVGILGETAPSVRGLLDLRGRPCVFELDFQALMALAPEVIKYKEPGRYPALHRHIAVVVSDSVEYARLDALVREAGGELVEDVNLLDIYKGEQVGDGRRSVTISVVFRSREKTLTDDEVNFVLANIKEVLKSKLEASFR